MTLGRRQQLCLDAIEHSFSMVEIAYQRVLHYCRTDSPDNNSDLDDAMVLDSWSFIDVTKRLRSVLEHTPGLKNSAPLSEFLRATEAVVDFRHHSQHIEDRTRELAPSGRPIWGAFSWAVLEGETGRFRVGFYIPGRIAKVEGVPVANPAGKTFRSDVDHVQIAVGQLTLRISDIYYLAKDFRALFEAATKLARPRQIKEGVEILTIDLDVVGQLRR